MPDPTHKTKNRNKYTASSFSFPDKLDFVTFWLSSLFSFVFSFLPEVLNSMSMLNPAKITIEATILKSVLAKGLSKN